MSNKPPQDITLEDRLIRYTAQAGDYNGTLVTIELICGFELFNTRPYHNYETWGQGYRVSGRGVTIEREDLDDAVRAWSDAVREEQGLPRLTEDGYVPKQARPQAG